MNNAPTTKLDPIKGAALSPCTPTYRIGKQPVGPLCVPDTPNMDEMVRPEPLPGPASSSFHCFTWTTNPTPHQTTQHWLRKGGGCPIHPWSGSWGEGAAPSPASLGYGPQGPLHQRWGSALSISSGPSPFLMPAGQNACLPLYLPKPIFIQPSFLHPTHLLSSYNILVRRRRRRRKPSLP